VAPDPPLVVVVTGPPASGKSTIARELADALAAPLIAKDPIKETLFDSLGTGDPAWSRNETTDWDNVGIDGLVRRATDAARA
jgi:predicted kinase